jgi:methylphosphotriester-DNA--protein-cysteine methyltransferase
MTSTELPDERIVNSMLREMVVEEALEALEDDRPPGTFTLEQIADFVGVSVMTLHRIEHNALINLKNKMIRLEQNI